MNLVKLKIKAKHLATEPAIIRHEEGKIQGWQRNVFQFHRIWDVRNEARATQLAIAFLKGKDIKDCEPVRRTINCSKHDIVEKRVISMVQKYSTHKVPSSVISYWFRGDYV